MVCAQRFKVKNRRIHLNNNLFAAKRKEKFMDQDKIGEIGIKA
jgi:hypothetical protein